MGFKIRKKGSSKASDNKRVRDRGDYIEVGRGPYCVVTINRHDGSTVVHRFKSRAEAEAQNRRNMAQDKPLVGVGPCN